MKKLNLDFFKIVIIVLLLWVAYSLHNFSTIERYQLVINNDGGERIIDTKSGRTFRVKGGLINLRFGNRNYEIVEQTKPIDEY